MYASRSILGHSWGCRSSAFSYAKPSNLWRNFRSTRSDEDVSLIVVWRTLPCCRMQTDDGMFLQTRHILASVSVSVSINCRTNTGSNAAGGRERRSHANSRTECSIPERFSRRSIHYIVFQMIPVSDSPHKEWMSMLLSNFSLIDNRMGINRLLIDSRIQGFWHGHTPPKILRANV